MKYVSYPTNAGWDGVRRELFLPTPEGEARLLLLINAFSGPEKSLEGRTKLAKLDFLLRYPQFFARAMAIRRPNSTHVSEPTTDIETRMVRYRFGPWDPAYFALLGRLIGRGLIRTIPTRYGFGYRASTSGQAVAEQLSNIPSWQATALRTRDLRRNFDLTGTTLKDFIYDHFPEVRDAPWGQQL